MVKFEVLGCIAVGAATAVSLPYDLTNVPGNMAGAARGIQGNSCLISQPDCDLKNPVRKLLGGIEVKRHFRLPVNSQVDQLAVTGMSSQILSNKQIRRIVVRKDACAANCRVFQHFHSTRIGQMRFHESEAAITGR